MNTKGERLLHEIDYIKKNQPVSSKQIGDFFGVTKHTVKGDVQILNHFGCEFDSSDGRNGGYVLKSAPSVEKLAVGEEKEALLNELIGEASGEKKDLLREMTKELAINKLNNVR